jgi:Protein of unknwon function (DUF3310)
MSKNVGLIANRAANSRSVAKPDLVSHPLHYTSDPSGVECITITRHRNFNIGNAIKYLWRAGLKDANTQGKTIEDLEKAIFYIKDEINRLQSFAEKGGGETPTAVK